MKRKIVEVKRLNASYNNNNVLENIDLTIHENDFLGIIGPNGGGKTTLIRCILGLKEVDSGEISFYKNGVKVDHIIIGYLPQYTLIDKKFPISVMDVVLSGLSCKKKAFQQYTSSDKASASKVIERMGLTGLEHRSIGELSGGQLQRAILGRSLIAEPDMLILDEPNTYIDKKFEAELYSLLKEIQQECAVVLISHDIVTTIQQSNCLACINRTLDYKATTKVSAQWLEEKFQCPISLLGFGSVIK